MLALGLSPAASVVRHHRAIELWKQSALRRLVWPGPDELLHQVVVRWLLIETALGYQGKVRSHLV